MTTIPTPLVSEVAAPMMSDSDLAGWGLAVVAYVRRVGPGEWAIHAADGSRIGTAPDRDLAFAALRQHDLEPLDAH